ncbi:MAG: hypothetical protein A2015_11315 [Spirochaetes bacterium GWF1_31_7]|nr:MAG: hypothetical protein A2Y30_02550 [Spirochaetes bacterium GWE1_32_154]OHD46826.1 MAG: hypothetical protein A2Y29_09835 [Spirochaetes bacterium GWE2_31_10]OHD47787.1 MAG: hypothetical protein A2015_11315 [Spirochaetes bacterium GWF1_31_7]OHD75332.1 MAG: hypothetical protein A2355_03400 [Spirochaetes bacterium RIFOXYB1_FULL_32_8]HBD95642.1 hypothetical protein [Spirochaetia bacterium]
MKTITLFDLYDSYGVEYITYFQYIENNGFSDRYYLDVKMRATYDFLVFFYGRRLYFNYPVHLKKHLLLFKLIFLNKFSYDMHFSF